MQVVEQLRPSSDEKTEEEPLLWGLHHPTRGWGQGLACPTAAGVGSDRFFFQCSLQMPPESALMPFLPSHPTPDSSVNPPSFALGTTQPTARVSPSPPPPPDLDHHHYSHLLNILPTPAFAPHGQGILHKKKSGHPALLLKAPPPPSLRGRACCGLLPPAPPTMTHQASCPGDLPSCSLHILHILLRLLVPLLNLSCRGCPQGALPHLFTSWLRCHLSGLCLAPSVEELTLPQVPLS